MERRQHDDVPVKRSKMAQQNTPMLSGGGTEGAPGTVRGREGTAGTEGANVARREREPGTEDRKSRDLRGGERGEGGDRGLPTSGVGRERSGTLPGSTGGTTGTSE